MMTQALGNLTFDVQPVEHLRTSRHEAGHAGLCFLFGRRNVSFVALHTITSGETVLDPPFQLDDSGKPLTEDDLIEIGTFAAAGREAVRLFEGDSGVAAEQAYSDDDADGSDMAISKATAEQLAALRGCRGEPEAIEAATAEFRERAAVLLSDVCVRIRAVACAIHATPTGSRISGGDLRKAYDEQICYRPGGKCRVCDRD